MNRHDEGNELLDTRVDHTTSSPTDSLVRGCVFSESGQTSQGSFSAVSKPNFANKYAFESSRQDLSNAHSKNARVSDAFEVKQI